MASIEVPNDAAWRELRQQHVGSSDVAALFNMHAYGMTKWQLWHVKRGTLPDAFEEDVMLQGKHFEPAIASYAQEKFSIKLRKVRRYLVADDCPDLGASVDYEQYGDGSLIPTELKWSLWGKDWEYEGDELTSISDQYMLQVQHQLAAMPAAPHAQLIAFTGGTVKRMIIPRHEALIASIKTAVFDFMQDVRAGTEPPVDFLQDAEAVDNLAKLTPLRSVELPEKYLGMFEEYAKAADDVESATLRRDGIKAALIKYVIDQSDGTTETKAVAKCGNHKMTISKVAENLGKLITPEMVGERVGGKKAHIRTTIAALKE